MPEFQNRWVIIKQTFKKVSIPLFQPRNKRIWLFKAFVISYSLVCYIFIFCFKTMIRMSFLIFIAKLMLIIPSYFWIIWWTFSQYPSFCYLFSILFVTYLFLSWFSFKIPYYQSTRKFFFMDIEKPFSLFYLKKGIKNNHNYLLLFNCWIFS